jgi:hypothetical protein
MDARFGEVGAGPLQVRRPTNTVAAYFFSGGPGISAVITALADAYYEAAIDQQTDV